MDLLLLGEIKQVPSTSAKVHLCTQSKSADYVAALKGFKDIATMSLIEKIIIDFEAYERQ